MAKSWIGLGVALAVGACGGGGPTTFDGQGTGSGPKVGPGGQTIQAALSPINGCVELAASIRARLTEEMNEALDVNLENAKGQIGQEYCYDPCYYGGYDGDQRSADVACNYDSAERGASPPGAKAGSPSDDGASEYTETNVQVAGVDEADFIKNDGEHIFVASGSELVVIDAWPAAQAAPIANVALEGIPHALFFEGDRLLIYAHDVDGETCGWGNYGYYGNAGTIVSVFDISDRSAPVLERTVELNGQYVNSRRVGNAVHSVVTFPKRLDVGLQTYDYEVDPCAEGVTEADVVAAYEELRESNLEIIAGLALADMIPSAKSTDYVGTAAFESADLFAECEGFFESSDDTSNQGYLTVFSVDLTDDSTFSAATILGASGTVYSSADALYVANEVYRQPDNPAEADYWNTQWTTFHKFNLDNDAATVNYAASGEVKGRLVNQFAMDEWQGDLRVAVTEGYIPNSVNAVHVLREVDPAQGEAPGLQVVGSVSGIAPTEDIRSARFDGDRGFIVTFKKTDPLYAIDFSNPTAPAILGELKIPGFSTYMHFIDDDHLLTIGFDADEQGSFAWFTGIMLQIFDVSDMTNPVLAHKEIIGSRGTTSDATDDHMAFTYFASKKLLAIPMGICEDAAGGGSYGQEMTFNGLMVYEVDSETGFDYVGGVDHQDAETETNFNCYNWWTSPNSQVKRSIFMDDFVFSVSPERIKVNNLAALDTDLVDLGLPQLDCGEVETDGDVSP